MFYNLKKSIFSDEDKFDDSHEGLLSIMHAMKQYENVSDYALTYFRDHERSWKELDMVALDNAFGALRDCYKSRHWVYVCGNGGSAAIANHFLCDHGKLISTGTSIKPKVYSLSNSMEMVSALGNDISFEESFSQPLRTMGEPDDVLFTISASGDSENVVRAIKVDSLPKANKRGLTG